MLHHRPANPSPVWLLNTPLVTNEGHYVVRRLRGAEARKLVHTHGSESAIGHAATAALVSELLDVDCPLRRVEFRQEPGQRALVFRLNHRLAEGKVLSCRADLEEVGYSFWLMVRTA